VERLKTVMGYAVRSGSLTANPLSELKPPHKPTPDGYHACTDDDITRFEAVHPVGTVAGLAMVLMLHTAPRRPDAIRTAGKASRTK